VPPGTYLVVATKAGHGFHEVYRTVPGRNSAGPGAFRHTHWKEKEGAVEFLPIQIPATDPAPVDMTRFAGGEFTLGNNKDFSGPAERRLVADFWLDCTEVTVDAYRDKAKLSPDAEGLPGDSAVTFVTFDDAVQYAERIGKRLPTEAEYEYAATGRGRRDFPWEDGLRRIPAWPLGAVRASPFDHTPTDPPVFGLYSNVVEWTSSPAVRYPDNPQLVQAQAPFRNQRVIRGGPYSVLVGHPDLNDRLINAGPRMRNTADSNSRHAGLGFRCAQSVAPPYLEAAPVSADH
jgi:formylglycine-generating enzyme required for sulfatase activity